MIKESLVIVAAKRTAIGSFQGQFSTVSATDLGATAIEATVSASTLDGSDIDEVIMGCVLSANLGQAPARQASIKAGLPLSTTCTTINKVCGSGMKAVMLACDQIHAGSANVVVAGGMESMTQAPYMLDKARGGYRLGNGSVIDHMFYDGLTNPYDNQLMGNFAEVCASDYQFSRKQQDAFSASSITKAQSAIDTGAFNEEIAAVTVRTRKSEIQITTDEEPGNCDLTKIPKLRPAFKKEGGTVTAANSSKISDGAASVIVMSEKLAASKNITPLARIVAHAQFAHEPEKFTTAPTGAIRKLLDKAAWSIDDVDLFEINEAFAVVSLAAIEEFTIPAEKLNVNGGACALGHPIGASGCRIIVTLIHALRAQQKKRGVASLCIGGGEATAIALEII